MEEEWDKPRWSTRLGAAALAGVLALVSFVVVSKVWRYGAPVRPPAAARAPVPASPVEVMLVPARPAVPTVSPAAAASTAPR